MSSPAADRSLSADDIRYVDEPPFLTRVAWRQLGALLGIGLAVFVPIGLALALAA